MDRYVCLLRGINVSGKNSIKMAELAKLFEGLGYADVRTYIQSGNVVFDANGTPAALARKIGSEIKKRLGLDITVFVRSGKEMRKAAEQNPYLRLRQADPGKMHITFLDTAPAPDRLQRLEAVKTGKDRYQINDLLIYLYCPGGYGRSKLSNANIERQLRVRATTRNWRTVGKLLEMLDT